jgi:tetratricopeptide (TPR) repeat protein
VSFGFVRTTYPSPPPEGPKIGLALIARNEETRLPNLLASVSGAFDYVALVDTGSKDKTVDVFNAWCTGEKERNPEFEAVWAPEPWVEDFSVPRKRADALLAEWPDCEYFVWADADDTLTHAESLRGLAASMPADIAAFVFDYDYGQDPHGNCVCRLKRERIVRRAVHGRWEGRVHEAQLIDGQAAFQAPDACEWIHHPEAQGRVPNRNLRILRRWLKDEPRNPRVLGYIGTELMGRGKVKQAAGYFRRYLAEHTGWDEERAQVHRKLAVCLIAMGKLAEAQQTALQALTVMPQWPDSYLTLAEVAYHSHHWTHAGDWSKRVLELGCPDTLLIVNPLEYQVQPRVIMAGSLGGLHRYGSAIEIGSQILALVPDHAEVVATMTAWRAIEKREQVAAKAVEDAQVLVAHDEQEKALILLEQCVPVFATDHPNVVAIRSQLRERLMFVSDPGLYAEHYEDAPDNAPDPDDERALEIASQLPRSHFLLEALQELEAA